MSRLIQAIPVDAIVPDPQQPRISKPTKEEDAALRESMRVLGLLHPIRVRWTKPPVPSEVASYAIVFGERRWQQAKALGWETIDAEVVDSDDGDRAMSAAAENMQRAEMHPVDQWIALERGVKAGMPEATVAMAIGIPLPNVPKLRKLAAIDKALLNHMRVIGLPDGHWLATIAMAPLDVQRSAFKAAGGKAATSWYRVASGCEVKRVSRAIAIFDVATSNVVFEEDLFADPDTDKELRFETTDIAGFLAAQKAAVQARIDASHGHMEWGNPEACPKGWVRLFNVDLPKRWKKDDPRRAVVQVSEDSDDFGEFAYVIIEPIPVKEPRSRRTADRQETVDADGDDRSAVAPSPFKKQRDPISKVGRKMIAEAQKAAVMAALKAGRLTPDVLLAALVLALAGRNVAVTHDPDAPYRRASFDDLAAIVVGPDGTLSATAGELQEVVVEALDRLLVFRRPDSGVSSGPVAEWIGRMIGAAAYMDRFDNPDFLGTVGSTLLADTVKTELNEKPRTGLAALRQQVCDRAPDWRPPGASFSVPGELVAPEPDPVWDEDADEVPVDRDAPADESVESDAED